MGEQELTKEDSDQVESDEYEDFQEYADISEIEQMELLEGFDPDLVVELKKVNKYFGGKHVIKNFDLEIARNEFVAVIGPSGSGKSTLLNIIGLLEKASSGAVGLFGQKAPSINSRNGRKLLREKISYLFQNAALIDHTSVLANLKIVQTYTKGTEPQKANDRQAALDAVGLKVSLKQKIYELSGGEQQRLALAQILLRPNPLILADEPTGSLDADNRDEVLRLLETLHEHQKTLLVVTHDPVVWERANRVVALS
ncbi:MAG: ATP-binding cassette domain-containing protein [Bifidobacteriaceae bacterium]|jgi:putative ABC transport system ATP-binding protein|nr:ATP-binding cassette domain-containing protein [Bifidobacteriaceae bacterium]